MGFVGLELDSAVAAARSLFSSLLRSLANLRERALACCFVCPRMYPSPCPCAISPLLGAWVNNGCWCFFLGYHLGFAVVDEEGKEGLEGEREFELDVPEFEVEGEVEEKEDWDCKRVGRGL